jgi:hypothetical protein
MSLPARIVYFISRVAAYLWALPTTAVGLIFIPPALVTGGKMRFVDGALEIHGGFVSFFLRTCTLLEGGASAMTLGHIVLGRNHECLDRTRSHERIHVRQCERWGPLFLPAYLVASLIAKLRGGDGYRDNAFEKEAFEKE